MKYYIETTVNREFGETITMVKEALKKEGFGVLSELDFRKTLKEKLDVEFRNYTVLGACNPPFAYKALLTEDKIGTMLPCNIVVQQIDEQTTEVAAVDSTVSMQGVENDKLKDIAQEIRTKLENVIKSLKD
jgi:uncharacterized protein (DUF302 family)